MIIHLKKNRRLKPHELETEYMLASIFRRPPRTYKDDKPFYPYCVPEPMVNFNLNYQ